MINPNIKKQYPVIKMPNGHPISATMYNRNTSQGVVYTNDEEIINTGLVVNLYATSTVVANINITHNIRSNLSATSELANATITKSINLESSISTIEQHIKNMINPYYENEHTNYDRKYNIWSNGNQNMVI